MAAIRDPRGPMAVQHGADDLYRREVIVTDKDGVAGLPAGETHIGQVGGEAALVDVTLSTDTSAYGDGDVLAEAQEVTNALRAANAEGVLQSLLLIDEDDQKIGMDILFFSAAVTLGTENSAPSISDADARNFLGRIAVSAGDYVDLGGVSVVSLRNLGLLLRSVTDSRSLYVAAIVRGGTPTYTATGLKLRLGIIQN